MRSDSGFLISHSRFTISRPNDLSLWPGFIFPAWNARKISNTFSLLELLAMNSSSVGTGSDPLMTG